MPSFEYALRLDGHNFSPVTAFLATLGSYVVVRETVDEGGQPTNPHMHVLLVTDQPIKVVRSRLVRALFPAGSGAGVRGNAAYSLTAVADAAKYRRYICKGVDEVSLPEVVGKCGVEFTDEWVADQHEQYWDVHRQLREAAARQKRTVLEDVYAACVAQQVRWDQDVKICRIYINELVKRNKVINVFSIRSSVNLIKIKLCPDDAAVDHFASLIADRV